MYTEDDMAPGSIANSRNLDGNFHGRSHFIRDQEVISVLELPDIKIGWKQSLSSRWAAENNAKTETDCGTGFCLLQLASASPVTGHTTQEMQSWHYWGP